MLLVSPMAVSASNTTLIEEWVILSTPEGVSDDYAQTLICIVNAHSANGSATPAPFMASVGFTNPNDGLFYGQGSMVPWETGNDLQAILDDVNASNTGELIDPFGGLNDDSDCLDSSPMNTEKEPRLHYFALGDSIAAGHGLDRIA
jgi:hypothetical protein